MECLPGNNVSITPCMMHDSFKCLTDEEVPDFVDSDVEQLDVRLVEHQIRELAAELEGSNVNLTDVYKYRDKKKELEAKRKQYETIEDARNKVQLCTLHECCQSVCLGRSCKTMRVPKREDWLNS